MLSEGNNTETVLIETLWNVNYLLSSLAIIPVLVLIETLWNVNYFAWELKDKGEHVLIETLWNVNSITASAQNASLAF